MSENAPASTPFYKNPFVILGGIIFLIVVVVLIVAFARGGDNVSDNLVPTPSPTPSAAAPSVAAPSSMMPATAASCKSFVDAKTCPASSATPVSATSCKSFVDAKVCPPATMTPASSVSCKSFVDAEVTRVTGTHTDPWCRKQYATLRTISPWCIKVQNELTYANAAIKTVFSRANSNYLKRTTKTATATSSSETNEFFLIEEAGLVVNSLAVADAKSTVANKYLLPASGAALYTTTVTTTPANFPKFNGDIDKLTADIRTKSAAIATTMWRRAMTNETSMSLVKAMYLPAVWTEIYRSTDGMKIYYKLDANKLATEFVKITKALPDSDYTNFCGTD